MPVTLRVDQLLGERLVGREVQVGEEGQALAHAVVLLGHGLLDLEHHVRLAPDVVGASTIARPAATYSSSLIGTEPGALLDEHVVTVATSSWTPGG